MTDEAATKELGFVGTGPSATEGRSTPSGAQRPVLSVVRGAPTPEQLAALTAVLAARASAAADDDQPPPTPSLWSRPQLRGPLSPGPGAWRASALPS